MSIFATIHFTRSLHDDLDVLRDAGLSQEADGLEQQLRSELAQFIDTSRLKIEGRETVDHDTYRFVTSLDLSGNNQSDPEAMVDNLVETLQRAYTEEYAAGHFDIQSVIIDGMIYDTHARSEVGQSVAPSL